MLGRKQEINLQLTEIFDSAVLAFCLWFSHYLRSQVVPMFVPEAIEIPPFEQFYWVLAVVPLFTPIALEEIHRMRAVEVASRGVSLGDFGLTVASDGQAGLAIVGVDPQGLAAQAGLKVGDRVLQEHRQGPLATTQDAKALAGKRELVLQVAQNSRLLWIRMRR